MELQTDIKHKLPYQLSMHGNNKFIFKGKRSINYTLLFVTHTHTHTHTQILIQGLKGHDDTLLAMTYSFRFRYDFIE